MKTLRLLTLAVTSLLTAIPSLAYDFSASNDDGVTIYYNILSAADKTVEVTYETDPYRSSYSGDIAIPEKTSYNGTTYAVTKIGDSAFYFGIDVTSVTIGNSVTVIGNSAFDYCRGLTSVTIGNSVTEIGERAFFRCTSLASVDIPDSVTKIGDAAFSSCTNLSAFYGKFSSDDNRCLIVDGRLLAFASNGLTSYSIPESVMSIGEWAFAYCVSLISITIPDSVTKIGASAFSNCQGLTSVTIPNSVTEIAAETFRYCYSLTSVTIPNSMTSIGRDAFSGCSLTSMTIPESVTTIDNYAFWECTRLTSVTFGNSVTTIGERAFGGCWSLNTIYAKPIVPPVCGYDAFEAVDKATTTLYVPQASLEVYKAADTWSEFLNIVPDTSSITEVAEDEDPDTEPVYYDLNGVRVDNPESGSLYIRQKGTSTQKIIY